jgi:cell division protein ZapA (FtsZ GTPase activity inhibitor)
MAKQSIKVILAGRTYPLSINDNESEKVQAAVDAINKNIKMLQDNYAVKDMQDLLAMTALQLATKDGKTNTTAPSVGVDLTEITAALKQLSDSF